jgi:hypothetical protein
LTLAIDFNILRSLFHQRSTHMPNNSTPSFDALIHELGHQLGTALGASLVEGLLSSVSQAKLGSAAGGRVAKPASRAVSAAVPAGKGCRVPRCVRRAATHGLCRSHYGKARRLNMKMDALGGAELATLAIDGRSERAAKKAAPAAKSSKRRGKK